jgi:tungstate transport system substrate-binding protein
MKKNAFTNLAAIGAILLFFGIAGADEKTIKMSTTTSTEASGLLGVLLPAFERDTGIKVKVLAKGTGAAIRDGIDGNVDVVFVHDTAREEEFVAGGYGTHRYAVMHNDFVIVGPPGDPAGIRGSKDASAALERIAASKASFVSRGDDSGTHAKEQDLWKRAGIPLETRTTGTVRSIYPKKMAERYLSIGQGMGKTLMFADEKKGYTLADRGTYIQFKHGKDAKVELDILCEGDPLLFNPYGVIPVNPAKFPHVRHDLAEQFAKWLVSPKGQSVIADYKILGQQAFFPDAVK